MQHIFHPQITTATAETREPHLPALSPHSRHQHPHSNQRQRLRLPPRLRPLVPEFARILARHRRCRYYQLLNHHCPLRSYIHSATLTPHKTRLARSVLRFQRCSVRFVVTVLSPSYHANECRQNSRKRARDSYDKGAMREHIYPLSQPSIYHEAKRTFCTT